MQLPLANANIRKPSANGCLTWLVFGLAFCLCLAVGGRTYELVAEKLDAQHFPPPGQLVDVDGHRMHLHCSGIGEPTVVIEAGLGEWSSTWGPVQEEVAEKTRVCTYDRAGLGWSEPGPLPRDAKAVAGELHTLLGNAGVQGPYVLVGHSLGGLPVRVFAREYAADVAGVVLVDSMVPQQFKDLPDAATAVLAQIGFVRIFANPLGLAPKEAPNRAAYLSRLVLPQNVQAFNDEMRDLPLMASQANAVTTLGDTPLVVLTAGLNDLPHWPEWQALLAALSSRGTQVVVADSGHGIHMEKPEAVVSAILDVVGVWESTHIRP